MLHAAASRRALLSFRRNGDVAAHASRCVAVRWRVALFVTLATAAVPLGYMAYSIPTNNGSLDLVGWAALLLPPPVGAGIVVGMFRKEPGARVAGFLGGAMTGAILFGFVYGMLAQLGRGSIDAAILPVALLTFVSTGAFLSGLGGLAGAAIAGGARVVEQPLAARAVDGRCGACGAAVTTHALHCAHCGAWTHEP